MTGRERILATLAREPVDRLPIDLGGTRQSGIAAAAYHRLRKHLGLPSKPARVFDTFQILAEIETDVLKRFPSDVCSLHRPAVAFGIPNRDWKAFTLPDGTPAEVPGGFNPETEADGSLAIRRSGEAIARMPAGGFYFDRFEKYPGALHPDLDAWDPPRMSSSDLDHYRTEAERLYRETDLAIVAPMGPPYELFFGIGQGDFEEWMVTFASEPEYVTQLYAKLVDRWIENLEAFHGAVRDRVQIIQICDDFGTQSAPFLSTAMFDELLLPAYKRGLDWIHQNTSWKVLLHSDGAIRPLLPSIIRMGVDILNPVQTTATGMEAAPLKRDFGDKIIFWGGACDCQNVLTFGTPDEVRADVRRHISALAPGGGLVFASVHNIQANVPAENIVALFDTALGV